MYLTSAAGRGHTHDCTCNHGKNSNSQLTYAEDLSVGSSYLEGQTQASRLVTPNNGNTLRGVSCDYWQNFGVLEFLQLTSEPDAGKEPIQEEPKGVMSCYLGNDIRDIKALEALTAPAIGSADKSEYLSTLKASSAYHAVVTASLPKKSTHWMKRVYGFLVKRLLASGEKVDWIEIWSRINNYLNIGGKSERRKEQWSVIIRNEMPGICHDYYRDGRSTKLRFYLKDEYQTRRKKIKIHPEIPSIRAKGEIYNSGEDATNSSKLQKLAGWMAAEAELLHYDNCKVQFHRGKAVNAFLAGLEKHIDKHALLALYGETLRKFHQIATDQDQVFAPTGLCKAVKSMRAGESASEAFERACRRLDWLEGGKIREIEQKATEGNPGASEGVCQSKGEAGGYYSTMEAFYAAQKAQQEKIKQVVQEEQPKEPEPVNLVTQFLNRHKVAAQPKKAVEAS